VQLIENDSDDDFDIEDIEQEQVASKLNMFPQCDTKGEIGSVHTSAVRLQATEHVILDAGTEQFKEFGLPKTSRRLSTTGKNKKLVGGQAYHPLLKSNTLTDQRKNMHRFTHLPLLLQRYLTSSKGSFDQNKEKMLDEIIEKFEALEFLIEAMSLEWESSGMNSVRFEFFVTSNMRNQNCDISLPVPNPWELITVVDNQWFRKHWAQQITVYSTPIRKFVQDIKTERDAGKMLVVSDFSPEIRTTLVFCTERCVHAANILGFRGRIMQSIWQILSHPRYMLEEFYLPSTVLVEVEAGGTTQYALKNPPIVQPNNLADGDDEETEEEGEYGKCR
jgi:hypothetical protein